MPIIDDTSITEILSSDDVVSEIANAPHEELKALIDELNTHHDGDLGHSGSLTVSGDLFIYEKQIFPIEKHKFTVAESWSPITSASEDIIVNISLDGTEASGKLLIKIDGINKILIDDNTQRIYEASTSVSIESFKSGVGSNSSNIITSFATPASKPTGLTYGGSNLISCDFDTDKIYVHDGITADIITSFATPGSAPDGLTYDGLNLISCDSGLNKIFVHDGVTDTITTSFASPLSNISGLTYDGTNLISCDTAALDTIYVHTGISATITTSFAAPGPNIKGLTYDGTNLISFDDTNNKIYVHDGITASILTSFSATNDIGLAYDGSNLIACNDGTNKIYVRDGDSYTGTAFATISY